MCKKLNCTVELFYVLPRIDNVNRICYNKSKDIIPQKLRRRYYEKDNIQAFVVFARAYTFVTYFAIV